MMGGGGMLHPGMMGGRPGPIHGYNIDDGG